MCSRCNYPQLLKSTGLGSTPNRLRVMEIIGSNNSPLSTREIYNTLNRTRSINRVTVYRILDLLVENGLIERINGGGRSFRYGLAPNEHHHPHPHFYCKYCGNMECLSPESLSINIESIHRTFPGQVHQIDVRVEGICKTCLNRPSRRRQSA
jgi:Fur family transcriptional regulator, ferric uptake regulator